MIWVSCPAAALSIKLPITRIKSNTLYLRHRIDTFPGIRSDTYCPILFHVDALQYNHLDRHLSMQINATKGTLEHLLKITTAKDECTKTPLVVWVEKNVCDELHTRERKVSSRAALIEEVDPAVRADLQHRPARDAGLGRASGQLGKWTRH